MNLETIARIVFGATLIANTDFSALVAANNVVGGYVDPRLTPPYVQIMRYSGGMDDDAVGSNASTSMWKITAIVDQDDGLALDIQTAINAALDDVMPIIEADADYAAWGAISLVYPYYNTYNKLNRVFIMAGGLYKLRLATKE